MIKYGIWFELQSETLTEAEKASLSIQLSEFPPMVLIHLKKRVKNIKIKNKKYYCINIPPMESETP